MTMPETPPAPDSPEEESTAELSGADAAMAIACNALLAAQKEAAKFKPNWTKVAALGALANAGQAIASTILDIEEAEESFRLAGYDTDAEDEDENEN